MKIKSLSVKVQQSGAQSTVRSSPLLLVLHYREFTLGKQNEQDHDRELKRVSTGETHVFPLLVLSPGALRCSVSYFTRLNQYISALINTVGCVAATN